MKVKDCLHRNVLFIEARSTMRSATAAIVRNPHQPLIILGEKSTPIGILTPQDIVSAIAEGFLPEAGIKDLPRTEAGTAGPDDDLAIIARTPYDFWFVYDNETFAGLLQRKLFTPLEVLSTEMFLGYMNAVMDSIEKPILAIDTTGKIMLCNETACTIINQGKEAVIGLPVTALLETSQPATLLQDNIFELVQKFKADGKTYITNWAPIRIQQGLVGAFAILRDMTDYEDISKELERVKIISQELNAIIDSSYDGIFVTDGKSRTLRINKAYERITGIQPHEVIGKTMEELVTSGFYNESVTLQVLQKKQPVTIVQHINKTSKTIVVTGNPIFDDNGAICRVVSNVRDVTELNQLQEKLKKMEQLQSRYESELQQFRKSADDQKKYVIKSKKMKVVYELARKLAKVDSTILITGESGVGKEVFSEIVHKHGARRKKPFMKISCAAIPESLLESELFGYESGAFTGASRDGKAGIFELVHGGTIFLDEIGELPMGLQVKLLRVLQEREIVRIGSSKPIKVDTRIMAATNRDLEDMVRHRQFRKDLFFRLNVVPVMIPPLRERKEAISHFIYFFLKKYNRKYGFSKQIAPEVIETLIAYDWPGNVRELENMVERLIVLAQGEIIDLDNLPGRLKHTNLSPTPSLAGKPLKKAMEEFEQQLLVAAVKKYGTSRKMAAALGVNQSTVVRKLSRYKISLAKS